MEQLCLYLVPFPKLITGGKYKRQAVSYFPPLSPCHKTHPHPTQPFPHTHTHTHKFKHVPVKDVVVGEALAVEEVTEELSQIRVVRFVIKPQRAAEVEVC